MSRHPSTELETAAADLVHRLGGSWRPGGAMCRCPAHEDRIASLSIRVGQTSLLFKCFAGCATIDVMRAIRRMNGKVPVLAPALRGAPSQPPDNQLSTARARRLWDDALPAHQSPVQDYLQGRGITILSSALRFHPRTPLGRGRAVVFRPAMLAAVTQGPRLLAVQRHFLDVARRTLATDLANPRLTLGRPLDGAVTLLPGGAILGLAEGVETAMSASLLLGIPVWAVLGNERLARIALPATVRRLVLLPDLDRAGRLAVDRARAAYAGPDLVVETLWPWGGRNDWNDVLRAKGKEGGSGRGDGPEGQAGRMRSESHVQSHPVRARGELREIALQRPQA